MSVHFGEYLTGNDSRASEPGYAVEFQNGSGRVDSEEQPACTFFVNDEHHWHRLTNSDPYQLATAFIRSEFEIGGDLPARFGSSGSGFPLCAPWAENTAGLFEAAIETRLPDWFDSR